MGAQVLTGMLKSLVWTRQRGFKNLAFNYVGIRLNLFIFDCLIKLMVFLRETVKNLVIVIS